MPLVATGPLVAEAAARRGAVPAFNVITLEHVEAVVAGAEAAGAPVLLQVSENAVRYRGGRLLPLARAAAAAAEEAAVPVGLHLDHVRDDALLRRAADAGFGSVMYDAAHLPYHANLAATRAAADWAHAHGLWVEAELGEVPGKEPGAGANAGAGTGAGAGAGAAPGAGGASGAGRADPHAPGARTEPGQARAFVAETGVDALAVAVGSSHAMTERTARLDHGLLARLAEAVPVPLVLHGSSGLPDAELAAAVAGGIAKVNVGTALNTALTGAVRAALAADARAVDCRGYLAAGREAMARAVAEVIAAVTAPARPPGGAACAAAGSTDRAGGVRPGC